MAGRRRRVIFGSIAALSLLAAACGGDDEGSDSTDAPTTEASDVSTAPTETGAPADSAAPGDSAAPTDSGAPAAGDVLTQLFTPDGPSALAGQTIKVGASITLSGTTASFGQDGLKGLQLAVKDIEAAGGPTFDLVVEDVQFDAGKGVAAARKFIDDGIGVQITAASAVLGSQIPTIEEGKLLTFDPSAGVGTLPSKPYFWAGKGETPNGPWAGAIAYVTQELPDAKTAILVGAGGGSTIDDTQEQQLKDLMEGTGLEYIGAERYPQGSGSDFSNTILAINEDAPDVIFLASYGPDPGNFMAQYAAAGGTAIVVAPEYTAEAAAAGGDAYNGMYFAQDNFLAVAPANAWATHFVEAYQAEYGSDPTIYSASYYDTLFLVWQLLELDGADPSDGEGLQTLLEANLGPYPTVVGAGDLSGEFSFDPETHAMSQRGYVIGVVEDGAPTLLASYGADGTDLKLS